LGRTREDNRKKEFFFFLEKYNNKVKAMTRKSCRTFEETEKKKKFLLT
jgi:hypothetical protein